MKTSIIKHLSLVNPKRNWSTLPTSSQQLTIKNIKHFNDITNCSLYCFGNASNTKFYNLRDKELPFSLKSMLLPPPYECNNN